jgi:alpha-tubulin suppressor-like RCC1 family protein
MVRVRLKGHPEGCTERLARAPRRCWRAAGAGAIAIGSLVACGRSSLDVLEPGATGQVGPGATGTGSASNSTSTARRTSQTTTSSSPRAIADAAIDWLDSGFDAAVDGGVASSDAPEDVTGEIPPHPEVLAISAGGEAACALLSSGRVACWGENGAGELGNGTTMESTTPVMVSNLSDAIAISVGPYEACALLADGTVDCWGSNPFGDTAPGTTIAPTPVRIPGLENVVAIATGWNDACALLADGTVQCWNNVNDSPGLGGVPDDAGGYLPGPVPGLSGVRAISAGNAFACALMSDGAVHCWGANLEGELGNGTMGGGSATPVPVSNLEHVTAISTGIVSGCALLVDGTVTCWGADYDRHVGDTGYPIPVAGLTSVVAVAPGEAHTCALLADQSIDCWGSNWGGAVGGADAASFADSPVLISGLPPARAIASAFGFSCALVTGGEVECWGDNTYGQLGNGTTTSSPRPVPVVWNLDGGGD